MPLTLTIRPADRTGNITAPPPLRLDRRGAVIGRAPGLDWTLPDERNTVSSRHCEIAFRDGGYVVADTSTNGTAVNGRRLAAPQRLNDGDVIGIGPYEAAVAITPDVAAPVRAPAQSTHSAAGGAAPAVQTPAGSPAETLLRAAGVRRVDVRGTDAEILAAAGTALREAVTGTAMLLDRRRRARSELGATADTSLAANPIGATDKGRPPLAELLSIPAAGGMPVDRAVAQAFTAIEAHQLATLKAMQGAMKATLERFAPQAIRSRVKAKGDAALWQEYERAFAAGDDAFIELFAREFQDAYEALAKRTPRS